MIKTEWLNKSASTRFEVVSLSAGHNGKNVCKFNLIWNERNLSKPTSELFKVGEHL